MHAKVYMQTMQLFSKAARCVLGCMAACLLLRVHAPGFACAPTRAWLHVAGVTCAECTLPVSVVNGTLVPAAASTSKDWSNLVDSQLTTVATTYGDAATTTAASAQPYIQVSRTLYTNMQGACGAVGTSMP